MEPCPCGSGNEFEACCEPFIAKEKECKTAEELLRSRYAAYDQKVINYILDTTHPKLKEEQNEKMIRDWANSCEWMELKILDVHGGQEDDTEARIEFQATYRENSIKKLHHEMAIFTKVDGKWYFEDGQMPKQEQVRNESPKVGRNDPCPCGSGKKYKKCCIRK